MDRAEFEAVLRRDGYEIVARDMVADAVNPDHRHDFDARILVTAGAITITKGDQRQTYAPGEWCAVAAGEMHSEQAGPAGGSYVAGRRKLGA